VTATEFEEYLDRYGADIGTWPAALAEPAQMLIERSAVASALHDEAQRTQAMLRDAFTDIEPIGLKTRILANLEAAPGRSWLDWLTGALWRPAALALVPLVLGFALGVNYAPHDNDFEDAVTLLVFADLASFDDEGFGADYEE